MESERCYNSSTLLSEDIPQKKREVEEPKESISLSFKPYMPPLPFPQQFAEAKLDSQFDKFIDVLKKLMFAKCSMKFKP